LSQEDQKRLVATAALSYIKDGIALGVGTGSTVDFLIDALPPYAAKLTAVVSSSERSTRRLEAAGIEVTPLAGAGELDPALRLHRGRVEARRRARPLPVADRGDPDGRAVRLAADGQGRRPTDPS